MSREELMSRAKETLEADDMDQCNEAVFRRNSGQTIEVKGREGQISLV
jgi:hypothetical protein